MVCNKCVVTWFEVQKYRCHIQEYTQKPLVTWISLAGGAVGCTQCMPADFHVASKWWHHDSSATICHRQGSKWWYHVSFICHKLLQICITLSMVSVQMFQTLMPTACLVSVRTYGTHSENSLWHQRYCMSASTVLMFRFNSFYMEWMPMSVFIHSTVFPFTILRISDNGGLSCSWHVFHSLPAHLRQMDSIHHHCLQYTYGTTDTDSTHLSINCSRLISIYSKKLNHHPLVLFGQINQLVSYF
jgi:hypothetical protein